MNAVRIPIDPADREAWLEDRRKRITATDAASILGFNDYRTPIDVYLEKIGVGEPAPVTTAMKIGTLSEPMALQLYREQTGRELAQTQLYAHHAEREWQAATFDAVDSEGDLVEVKTVGFRSPYLAEIGEPGSEELPRAWLCQVYHQLEVAGAELCHVAIVMGTEFQVHTIRRDRVAGRAITEAESDFWNRHVAKLRKPPASRASDFATIAKLFPEREGGVVWSEGPVLDQVAEYVSLGEDAKKIEVRRGLLKASILDQMGPHAKALTSNGFDISAKTVNRPSFTVKATSYVDFRVKATKTV